MLLQADGNGLLAAAITTGILETIKESVAHCATGQTGRKTTHRSLDTLQIPISGFWPCRSLLLLGGPGRDRYARVTPGGPGRLRRVRSAAPSRAKARGHLPCFVQEVAWRRQTLPLAAQTIRQFFPTTSSSETRRHS